MPEQDSLKDLNNIAEALNKLGYATVVIGGEEFGDASFISAENECRCAELSCTDDQILLEFWTSDREEEPAQSMTVETWLEAIESSHAWLRAA